MKEIVTYFTRFKKMDGIIREGHTGTPEEFADKLGIPIRSFYEHKECYAQLLAPDGITIVYNRFLRTYQYSPPGYFEMKFIKKMTSSDTAET
jgi:hypothetical protein